MTFADNEIAGRETFHVFAHKIDNPHKFVTDGHRDGDRFLRPGVPIKDVDVSPADGRLHDADEHIVTVKFGNGNFFEPKPWLGAVFYHGPHRFLHKKEIKRAVLRRNLLSEDFAGCQICRERCWRRVFEFGSELLPLQKFVCVSLRNLWTKFLSVGMMERHARNS